MEYCSLEYAFTPPNQEARKQERKKAKRCKGPALAFINSSGPELPDPDVPSRSSTIKHTASPAMNPSTGLREHSPVDVETTELFEGDIVPKTIQEQNAAPSFFGKDPADNFASFSHVVGDSKEYRLQPDFADSFRQVGTLSGAGATAALPTPSVRDIWKPLTPTGARSSFFEALPPPGGEVPVNADTSILHSKLDRIFARLDELESNKTVDTANSQTEVLLFIMSGIFVLFSMDLLVRKTGNVRITRR